MTPDVSIVIPVYNEEGILREAVSELLDRLPKDLAFEIILAENGSNDRTVELATARGVRDHVRVMTAGETDRFT